MGIVEGIPVPERRIVGGQNLDAGFIEIVLDILMQVRIDACHLVRILNISVDLINGVEVAQGRFEDERSRFRHHSGRCLGCIDQKLVYLSPRRVIADRHFGMDDKPVTPCRRTVIYCL